MITNSFFIPLKELGFAVMDSGVQRIKLAHRVFSLSCNGKSFGVILEITAIIVIDRSIMRLNMVLRDAVEPGMLVSLNNCAKTSR